MNIDQLINLTLAILTMAAGLAVVVESSYQVIKKILAQAGIATDKLADELITAGLGLVAAYATPVVMFQGNHTVDLILKGAAGLAGSRGSNFVHDALRIVSTAAKNRGLIADSFAPLVSLSPLTILGTDEAKTQQPEPKPEVAPVAEQKPDANATV